MTIDPQKLAAAVQAKRIAEMKGRIAAAAVPVYQQLGEVTKGLITFYESYAEVKAAECRRLVAIRRAWLTEL
jgi:hypothetical protein